MYVSKELVSSVVCSQSTGASTKTGNAFAACGRVPYSVRTTKSFSRRSLKCTALGASDVLESYEALTASAPLMTAAVTSGLGFVGADLLAQSLSFQESEEGGLPSVKLSLGDEETGVDVTRMARMGLFGLLFHGPVGGQWYGFLDANIFPGEAVPSAASVFIKTASDQVVWAPLFITALFSWNLAWGEGSLDSEENSSGSGVGRLSELPLKLQNDLLNTLKVNWTFWPFVHIVNFNFIPAADRILYVNVAQVFFNVFLCWQAAKPVVAETEKEKIEV